MADKLATEIQINLAGNLVARARQFGASVSQFASRHQKSMRLIQATASAAGRGLDMLGSRYATMIAGFAGGALLRNFAQAERQMTQLGVAAGKTHEEMRELRKDILDVAIKFKVDSSELTAAVAETNKVSGDLDFASNNKNVLAATMAASQSDGASVGGLLASIQKFRPKTEDEALQMMDIMNALGKTGAFEMKDFAQSSTRFLSNYGSTGRTGPQAVKEAGVMLEAAMDAVGDSQLAVTAANNLLNDLRNPKIESRLNKAGVTTRDKTGNLLPLTELTATIAQKFGSNGGREQDTRLGAVGFTDYSRLLISSVTTGKGRENFERYNAVVADGSGIMNDAQYVAQDFTSAMTGLRENLTKFADANLAGPVKDLADAINSLKPETVQTWLNVGKNIALVGAGLVAMRKTYQMGKGIYDIINPVKSTPGIPQGVSDVFGSGVMPVYVVNMGKGLSTPGTDNGENGPGENNNKNGNSLTTLPLIGPAMGAAAGMFDFLWNRFPETAEEKQALKDEVQRKNARPTIWDDIVEWALPAANTPTTDERWQKGPDKYNPYAAPPQPQELRGEIRVVVEGEARVKSVRMDSPGVDLTAAAGVAWWRQN